MAELRAYRHLKKIMPKGTFFQRIETMAGAGIPDLYVCCHGVQTWVELKEGRWDANDVLKLKHIRTAQRAWARQLWAAGGNVVMYVAVGRDYYCFDHVHWPRLVEGMPRQEALRHCQSVLRALGAR